MKQSRILLGVLAYEFKMQIRRSSLWIAYIGVAALLVRTMLSEITHPQFFGLTNAPIFYFQFRSGCFWPIACPGTGGRE